jgi:hypothetical protein
MRQTHVRSQVDVGQLALKPGSRRKSYQRPVVASRAPDDACAYCDDGKPLGYVIRFP